MRKLTTLLFLMTACLMANSQSKFPNSHTGTWTGSLNIYGDNGKLKMEVPMELHIGTTVVDSVWNWEIHYLHPKKASDIRKYKLVAVDKGKGHYIIDELNGIKLFSQLYAETLVSRFSVQNNLLLFKYGFEKDTIIVEMVMGKEDKKEKTGDKKENNIPAVYNYNIGNYQKAVLTKKKAK